MERILKSTLQDGAFMGVSPTRSRIMASIRGKSNKSTEVALRLALVRAGIRGWVLHPADLQGRPDFYFVKQRLAVFVDGCFWHGCPRCGHIPKTRTEFWAAKIERNRSRDRKNRRLLASKGVKVLRVWEHELRESASVQQVLHKLRSHL
jgi:DNA mismatch endonuclease (patch repair protein)